MDKRVVTFGILIGSLVILFLLAIFLIMFSGVSSSSPATNNAGATATATSSVPVLARPTLIYYPALNKQKAYVQLVWSYDFAPAFNIFRSSDNDPTWWKINQEPHPSGARAAVDTNLPKGATVLNYRINPLDSEGRESAPSAVASIVIASASLGQGNTASTTYASGYKTGDFSISVPNGYKIDENPQIGHGLPNAVSEVRFTIPQSMATGTNLSLDTSISVVRSPVSPTKGCVATLFTGDLNVMGAKFTAEKITDQGVTYSYAKTGDAAAGNRYEVTGYAIPGTNPCIGVLYFLHYTVINNYPDGTVTVFDSPALYQAFDSIRRTLKLQK